MKNIFRLGIAATIALFALYSPVEAQNYAFRSNPYPVGTYDLGLTGSRWDSAFVNKYIGSTLSLSGGAAFGGATLDSTVTINGGLHVTGNSLLDGSLTLGAPTGTLAKLTMKGNLHIEATGNTNQIRFTHDGTDGFGNVSSGEWRLQLGGSTKMRLASSGVVFTDDITFSGGDIMSTTTTTNVLNSTITTLNLGGAVTTMNLGAAGGVLNSRLHLLPNLTDTYDLGSSTKLWRKGWLSEMQAILFAENTISILGGWFYLTKGQGAVDEDVDASETQIDFGADGTLADNDFIIFRNAGQVEYMQVDSNVTGNVWEVVRNVDGSGANTWAQGTPFANLGYNGNGRIELNANETPRMSMIRQGTAYNTQTELLRTGDLNGGWGYAAEMYGFAVGEYAAGENSVTLDQTNGLRFFGGTDVYGQLNSTTWTLGNTTNEHVNITATAIQLRDGATTLAELTGGNLSLKSSDGTKYIDIGGATANELNFVDGGATIVEIGSAVIGGLSGIKVTDGAILSTSSGAAPGQTFYAEVTSSASSVAYTAVMDGTGDTQVGYDAVITGASTTNIGVRGSASNAGTNWAGYFADGNVKIENDLDVDGDITANNMTNSSSGTYTPTLFNVENVSASTAVQCQYMRVGNRVTVSGRVTIDPTTTTTLTQLGISLPIASNIGNSQDCGGTAAASGVVDNPAAIIGDAINDRAELSYVCSDVTNHNMFFTFMYSIY